MSDVLNGADYHAHFGDCIAHMHTLPEACVDCSLYSPPFPSVYSYTSEMSDMGNTEGEPDVRLHFGFFCTAMARVMKPGRAMVVHCADIVRMKRSGGQGLFDFRGLLIRIAERAGFVYEYSWMVRKAPQAQALRTKAWELKFQGLETDRSACRGSLPDWLLKFRAPGDNAVPVNARGEVSRNDWIEWAEPCWGDIKETKTLNGERGKREARGADDVKHIAPLQLEVIDRLVRLFSDPGEVVFSPFMGIGSEGVVALKRGRRFYGCELKKEYFHVACRNLETAARFRREEQKTLFDSLAPVPEEPAP